MTTAECVRKLDAFIAGRRHDPVVDRLTAKAAVLEGRRETCLRRQVEAQKADVDARLRAEEALANGEEIDHEALHRLHAIAVEQEETARLIGNAHELIRREIAEATAARAERDMAILAPIFAGLVALYHERALAVVEVQEQLERAHQVANGSLPCASTPLTQGFGGLLTAASLAAWYERATALLAADGQRVA